MQGHCWASRLPGSLQRRSNARCQLSRLYHPLAVSGMRLSIRQTHISPQRNIVDTFSLSFRRNICNIQGIGKARPTNSTLRHALEIVIAPQRGPYTAVNIESAASRDLCSPSYGTTIPRWHCQMCIRPPRPSVPPPSTVSLRLSWPSLPSSRQRYVQSGHVQDTQRSISSVPCIQVVALDTTKTSARWSAAVPNPQRVGLV